MGKSRKGKGGYNPAPWSADYKANKRGGKAPWYRELEKRYDRGRKAPWSNPLAGLMRGGGR